MFIMKKIVLTGLAVLLVSALSTCDMTPIGNVDEYTNVVYQFEGDSLKSVKILFDEVVPVTKNYRALTQSLAQIGLEFFEVVFYDGTSNVRTSWNWNRSVTLNGITRDLNYATVSATGAAGPAAGSAILFAGSSFQTLLAVGEIVEVNDVPSTQIDNNTRSVTFGLSALVMGDITLANVSGIVKKADAFVTLPYTPTNDPDADVYVVQKGSTAIAATYALNFSGSPTNTLREGVITRTGGLITIDKPKLLLPNRDIITIGAPNADGFSGTVTYTAAGQIPASIPLVLAAGAELGAISFYFEIPVVALTDTAAFDGTTPLKWFVRAGSDYRYLALPNRSGASVLVEVVDLTTAELDAVTYIEYSEGGIKIGYTGP